MKLKEAMESLKAKFTSGNDTPVERAIITREEWESICKDSSAELMNKLSREMHSDKKCNILKVLSEIVHKWDEQSSQESDDVVAEIVSDMEQQIVWWENKVPAKYIALVLRWIQQLKDLNL